MGACSFRARTSGSNLSCNLFLFAHALALLILLSRGRREDLLLSSKAAAAPDAVRIKPFSSRFVIRRKPFRSSCRSHSKDRKSFAIRGMERQVRVQNWLSNLFGGGEGGSSEAAEFPQGTFEYVQPPIDTASILQGTALNGRELARCYQASLHGWEATDFHERCDNKGPSLVIARTTGGDVVGGFMPLEWKSSNDYRETNMDFLFYVSPDNAPTKLQKKDFSPVYDYRRGGPQWGSEALIIGEPIGNVMGVFTGPDPVGVGIGNLKKAKSRLGLSYELREDGAKSLFGDKMEAELQEVEVYCSPEIATMYL